MHITRILSQHRRDFIAEYKCEHCDHSHASSGYDDAHFHNNVVPDMLCPRCRKAGGESAPRRSPKYAEGRQI